MFSEQYLPYTRALAALTMDSQTRVKVAAYGVALACAAKLPLPSGPVDNPVSFFGGQHGLNVQDCISAYNEEAVLDCASAIAMTGKFWLLRYNMAFGDMSYAPTPGCFFMGYTGAGRLFSAEEHACLDSNVQAIFVVQMACCEIQRLQQFQQSQLIAQGAAPAMQDSVVEVM